jgi:hypothetical protein
MVIFIGHATARRVEGFSSETLCACRNGVPDDPT